MEPLKPMTFLITISTKNRERLTNKPKMITMNKDTVLSKPKGAPL